MEQKCLVCEKPTTMFLEGVCSECFNSDNWISLWFDQQETIKQLQAEIKELRTWQKYEKWATTKTENIKLKDLLRRVEVTETWEEMRYEINQALNQSNNKSNNSSTSHTQGGDTK